MNILWINHFAVAPTEGGGTRHFELGRELVRMGWGVTIAASDFNLQLRRYVRRESAADRALRSETLDGVQFDWLWAAPYTGNNWRRVWNWLSFCRSLLTHRGNHNRPDVVIGSSPHLFAALAGERLARRWGVPFVFEVRDLWPESIVAAGGRKGPAYHVFSLIARYLYRRADRIVVLASGSAVRIAQQGASADRIVYVPNGADVGAFSEIHLASRSTSSDFTLLYAGAHGPANGLDVVLDAAEILKDRGDIHFLLLGDGPVKASLETSARARQLSNVEFRAPVAKREMPALMASVNAGLMVLRDSPLFAFGVSPNKLFDYLSAALPVVCNVPGDVAAMVKSAGAGEQATDGSARALAEAILRLRDRSSNEQAEMGRSGRAWVEREHGRPILAARLDAMLRDLLGL